MTDETGDIVITGVSGSCLAIRETPGAVRYRTGGDIGHPAPVLQQQFHIEEIGDHGRPIGIRSEWRDVPWIIRHEEKA